MSPKNKRQDKIISDEYRTLLIDSYKENQNFLNKLILSVSTLAIPLLFEQIKILESLVVSVLLAFSLASFVATVLIQIYSLKTAREGCDKSLSSNPDDLHTGSDLLMKAKRIDLWRDKAFIFALILILFSVITSIATKEHDMNNKNRETGWLSQAVDKSFTPPASQVTQYQKPATSEPSGNGKQVETTSSDAGTQTKK